MIRIYKLIKADPELYTYTAVVEELHLNKMYAKTDNLSHLVNSRLGNFFSFDFMDKYEVIATIKDFSELRELYPEEFI